MSSKDQNEKVAITRYTPFGRMHMLTKEFYFRPKFSLNFLPYAEDGMFVEEDLEVMFKFDSERSQWNLRGIWGPDLQRVYVNEETLKNITSQGLLRINFSIDWIFDQAKKEASD